MLFSAYDLVIESEMPLPGAAFLAAASAEATVTIVRAAIKEADVLRRSGPYSLCRDGSLLFHRMGLAQFRMTPECLTVYAFSGSKESQVAAMLIATALPALLWLRGEIVLHAAAAIMPGSTRAVAIAGESGTGKSSLLQDLLSAGAQVLTDDTLRLHEGSPLRASGLPGALHRRLPLPNVPDLRVWTPVAPQWQCAVAPLGAVIVLGNASCDSAPGLTRLRGPAALQVLLCSLHRPRIPELLHTAPLLLPRLAAMLSEVRVYRWIQQSSTASRLPTPAMLTTIADNIPKEP